MFESDNDIFDVFWVLVFIKNDYFANLTDIALECSLIFLLHFCCSMMNSNGYFCFSSELV